MAWRSDKSGLEPKKKLAISKAEIKIELEKAKAQLEIDQINLANRAKLRLYETEIHRQLNLETIVQQSMNTIDARQNQRILKKIG